MFFSAITKNVNLEFWTKNLVTFKRPDGLTMINVEKNLYFTFSNEKFDL